MKKGFLNILIYILFPTICTLCLGGNINNKEYIFYMLISYILLTFYFLFKYKEEILNDFKNFKLKYLKIILIYLLIGFSLTIFSNYIINYIIIPNGISNNEAANRELLFNNKIIYSLLICLIIPFIEEIAFRLEFKKNIKNKYIFIFVSAFSFALLHIISTTKIIELIYIIPYLIIGITFSSIYNKTENIISNILAHQIYNTINVIILLFF